MEKIVTGHLFMAHGKEIVLEATTYIVDHFV